MARHPTIEVCGLNIVASPHPKGIYPRLLRAAAGKAVIARGPDWAKISSPKLLSDDGAYEGRILVWTAIDIDGRWLDIETDEELSEDERRGIVIPPKAKPNYRVFSYVLLEKSHRLYYESRNEFGETLGPTVARRIFYNLLHDAVDSTRVEITIIPQPGAVEKILALPRLRRLEIKLLLPNPDDVDPNKQAALYEKLRKMNARSIEQNLQKQAGRDRLKPDDETRDLALVAAENGYVKGDGGRGEERVQLSTTDTPQRKRINLDKGKSFFDRLLATRAFF